MLVLALRGIIRGGNLVTMSRPLFLCSCCRGVALSFHNRDHAAVFAGTVKQAGDPGVAIAIGVLADKGCRQMGSDLRTGSSFAIVRCHMT